MPFLSGTAETARQVILRGTSEFATLVSWLLAGSQLGRVVALSLDWSMITTCSYGMAWHRWRDL